MYRHFLQSTSSAHTGRAMCMQWVLCRAPSRKCELRSATMGMYSEVMATECCRGYGYLGQRYRALSVLCSRRGWLRNKTGFPDAPCHQTQEAACPSHGRRMPFLSCETLLISPSTCDRVLLDRKLFLRLKIRHAGKRDRLSLSRRYVYSLIYSVFPFSLLHILVLSHTPPCIPLLPL